MEQEQLIKLVTAEVMRQITGLSQISELAAAKPSVRALAIFTGGTIGLEQSFAEMKQLQMLGFDFSVVLSCAAEKVIGRDKIKAKLGSNISIIDSQVAHPGRLLRENELVLIPVLTQNTAAKLAQTISDTFVTTLVMQALMMGKPVIAAYDAADPQANWRVQADMGKSSAGLLQSLHNNLDKLKLHGMKLVPAASLAAASQKQPEQLVQVMKSPVRNKKNVIGAPAVKNVVANGLKELTVPLGTIITPLARDVARDLGVKIIEE